jgi:hypothetical protein
MGKSYHPDDAVSVFAYHFDEPGAVGAARWSVKTFGKRATHERVTGTCVSFENKLCRVDFSDGTHGDVKHKHRKLVSRCIKPVPNSKKSKKWTPQEMLWPSSSSSSSDFDDAAEGDPLTVQKAAALTRWCIHARCSRCNRRRVPNRGPTGGSAPPSVCEGAWP